MKKLMGSFKTLVCALAVSALVLPGCGGGKSLDKVLPPTDNALEEVYLGQEPAMKTKVEMNPTDASAVVNYKDADLNVVSSIAAAGATYVGEGKVTDTILQDPDAKRCNKGCHEADLYGKYNQTNHATALKRKSDAIATNGFKNTCVYCHSLKGAVAPVYPAGPTLGVPTRNAKAPIVAGSGAFGLTPADYSALTNAEIATLADSDTDFSLGGDGGIQCENCHGPGSLHIASPGKTNIVGPNQAASAATCAVCHDAPTHHIKPTQWRKSGHAFALFEAGAGNELHMATYGCNPCHSQEGFVDYLDRKEANVATTNVDAQGMVYAAKMNVNCAACHDPHANYNDGQLRLPYTELCGTCHGGDRLTVRGPLNTRGPHHNIQQNTLAGQGIINPDGKMLWTQDGYLCSQVGGKVTPPLKAQHSDITTTYVSIESPKGTGTMAAALAKCDTTQDYIETIASTVEKTMGETTCVNCHMGDDAYALPDHTMVVKEKACQVCHAGMDAPAVVGGVQGAYVDEYAKLDARFQKMVTDAVLVGSKPTAWETGNVAAATFAAASAKSKLYWQIDWNMKYLSYDGSKSFHNKEFFELGVQYTDQMLKSAGY